MIYNEDCFETMKRMENNSIDAIITDPPYFLPASHYCTRKQFNRNFSDLGILEHFFKDIFLEFKRILKDTGVIYMFCDGQSYPLFYYHLFPFCKSVRPLIWDKKTSINGYSWRHQHELIIFAEIKNAPKVPTGDGDILRFSAVKVNDRIHPAQKPIELLESFILKSTKENDLIYDPFAGSGSTLLACKNLNRRYIGSELSSDYFNTLKTRLDK
jgi:site-specific DNA-methyltransferase (adenine-specific)